LPTIEEHGAMITARPGKWWATSCPPYTAVVTQAAGETGVVGGRAVWRGRGPTGRIAVIVVEDPMVPLDWPGGVDWPSIFDGAQED
jgi:hypothetical protein